MRHRGPSWPVWAIGSLAIAGCVVLISSYRTRISFSWQAYWKGYVKLEDADLRGWNLDGLRLRASDFEGSDLAGASLVGTDLTGSDLGGTNLADSDLDRSILKGATFRPKSLRGCRLKEADLSRTDLKLIDFSECDLEGTSLLGSNAALADFSRAKGLTARQIMEAKRWPLAYFSPGLRQALAALGQVEYPGGPLDLLGGIQVPSASAILSKWDTWSAWLNDPLPPQDEVGTPLLEGRIVLIGD